MALTPEMIQQLSEPIEEVYRACVDELLLNIASHLEGGNALSTLNWEVTKLAEMGQLRRENIDIIKSITGDIPALLDGTFGTAIMTALEDIEEDLAAAVAADIFQSVPMSPMASQSIINILTNYSEQATNKLNLVNTVMLDSSLAQYRKVIANTAIYEKQLEQAQKILNVQTGMVATGVSSRTQALRKAVKQMNAVGLTGFKDAAGRNWSAEAYVNMDIRTTVHNVAVQSVFARNDDYGNSLISVSSHNGARPLCYPYQGKVYSTDGSSGQVEDLHGHTIDFVPLEDTSYGLPAGLFGINCGHMPSVFIPGMSVVRGEPQDKESNDKAYKLSQQQRRLEREVKNAKREAALLNAAGDKEGFEKAALKIEQKQANLNKFTISTGRTMRLDRLQVSGYDRSVAGKVTSANIARANRSYAMAPTNGSSISAGAPNNSYAQPTTSKAYAQILQQKYSNGTATAKAVYAKYVPNGGAVSRSDAPEGAIWYLPKGYKKGGIPNTIEMNYLLDENNLCGPGFTWFHEHGHFIDANSGYKSRSTAFRDALMKDYNGMRRGVKAYLQSQKAPHDDVAINEYLKVLLSSKPLAHQGVGISDAFSGCSDDTVRGLYHHTASHWQQSPYNLTSEAFANMFESQFDSNKEAMFKQFFPSAYAEFEKILGGLL